MNHVSVGMLTALSGIREQGKGWPSLDLGRPTTGAQTVLGPVMALRLSE